MIKEKRYQDVAYPLHTPSFILFNDTRQSSDFKESLLLLEKVSLGSSYQP